MAGLCSLAVGALLPASRDKARGAPGDSDLSVFGRAGRRSPTDGSDGGTDGDRRDASSSCGPHAPSSSSTPAQTRLAGCEAGPLQALASNAAPAAPAAAADLRVCSWRRRRRRRSRPLIDQPHADLGLPGEVRPRAGRVRGPLQSTGGELGVLEWRPRHVAAAVAGTAPSPPLDGGRARRAGG